MNREFQELCTQARHALHRHERYRPRQRIELVSATTPGLVERVPVGTRGHVTMCFSNGHAMVEWDNGVTCTIIRCGGDEVRNVDEEEK